MRQNFDVKGGPQLGRTNLPKLRDAMKAHGLDGFYIPHEDEYQNEYLPACNDRLTWATGFTGSAGAAMVFQDMAVIFADGRYTLQVRDQIDVNDYDIAQYTDIHPGQWAADNLKPNMKCAIDPKLFTMHFKLKSHAIRVCFVLC